MLLNEIPKEKITYCIEKLNTLFNPAYEEDIGLIKRAIFLYRNGFVFNAKVQDETISANVLDEGETFEIELELDFMEISFCSCGEPEDMFCVHKLAALFYVFSLFDSPGQFYANWKKAITKPSKKDSSKKMKASTTEDLPYEINSLSSWLHYFDTVYDQFMKKKKQQNSFYFAYNRDVELIRNIFEDFYPMILDVQKPPSQLGNDLFHIHAALYTIEKLFETAKSIQSSTYVHQHLGTYVHQIIKDILDILLDIHNNDFTVNSDDEKILSATGQRMMDILLNSRDFQHDRFYLFQIICSNLLNRKNWLDELEQKFTLQFQKEEHLRKLGKVHFTSECRLALAQFEFMRENDGKAINILNSGDAREVYYYSTWVKALAQSEQWSRFEQWLEFVEERMDQYIHQFGEQQLKRELTDFYLYFIEEYSEKNNKQVAYLHTLQKWLPYSYHKFSEYLLEKQEFRKWTELQLFLGISFENIDTELVKRIEKEDRACILPLLHNAIEDLINAKNRDAYRQAAKYLRKLRTHYRSLKNETTWDHYIDFLAKKYKRLRAFQEELRKGKGKLIND
ncbi:hypothetical protein [Bacillus sp. Marseille-P3661]|uniref:hypothetical protein n=1 Tax=Bacillus sp. Marseille-P3661 TaxID=1936234 RepID=UPI000C8536CC|nr:hypothetical protein [Bacillus sp. Marseille-P3661]